MIKLKRYIKGILIGSLAKLLLLSSAYATANDGPNLKGHWVDEKERCVAEAAGLAYATPNRNGIYTTVCSGKSVLAFRGTDMQGNDVWADIEAAFGGNYQMALDQVDWNGVSESNKWDICTGHSLGGGIAKRFAHNYSARCGKIITFGAPAIQTKPKKEKVTEYINYLRGSKIWDYCDAASCGPDAYRRFKDIVPTAVIGGHQNIKRLKNWHSHGIPKVVIDAHGMYHYNNKMLGDCPSIDMVQRTPLLEQLTKWYVDEEFDLSQDHQACWIKSRQGTLFPVKRFVCTAGNDHGNPNCADRNVITHDYANEDTFKKGKSVFPVNQCTSSWSGTTKTTRCTAGIWKLSGRKGEPGNNGNLKFRFAGLPAHARDVKISLTTPNSNSGDADLYVRQGVEEASTSNYDCRSWETNKNETCSMGDYSKGGIYNILVSRYSDYVNYHLTAEYKEYDLDF